MAGIGIFGGLLASGQFSFNGPATLANIPSCSKGMFGDWRRKFTKTMLALVPSTQATVIHISNAGNDSTGDGSAGNPYLTVAKANALMGANKEFRFRYGDEYREATGLVIGAFSGVVCKGYAFGGRTAKDGLPRITKFQADYSAGGWTLVATKTFTYQRTDLNASNVAWLRERDSVDQATVYRRMTSIAEVEATPGSWWATGTLVYIHPWDDRNPSSDGRVYHSVLKNGIDGCAVDAGADLVWLEDLRFDGWGCNPDSASAFYGIHVNTAGAAKAVVVKRCEAYYNGRHCIGLTSAGDGCQFLAYHCSAGWSTPTGDNPIVDYSANGGQVAVWEEPRIVAGNLPTFAGGATGTCYAYASGCPAYVSHTGAGNVRLSIVYKPNILDGPYGCGWLGSCQAAPDCSADISLARCFMIDAELRLRDLKTVQETNLPWSNNVGMTLQQQGDTNCVHINCWIDMRCFGLRGGPGNGSALSNLIKGYYINCVFDGMFDCDSHVGGAGGYRPWFWNGIANELGFFWNCWINFRTRGPVNIGIEGQCVSNNNVTFCSPNMKFRNCVFTALKDSNAAAFYLGLNNNRDAAGVLQTGDARSLLNNAYGCDSGKTDTYRGYDQDPYLVDIPTSTPIARPNSDSLLVSANQQNLPGGYRLEYDMQWRPRSASTARGPNEASS